MPRQYPNGYRHFRGTQCLRLPGDKLIPNVRKYSNLDAVSQIIKCESPSTLLSDPQTLPEHSALTRIPKVTTKSADMCLLRAKTRTKTQYRNKYHAGKTNNSVHFTAMNSNFEKIIRGTSNSIINILVPESEGWIILTASKKCQL